MKIRKHAVMILVGLALVLVLGRMLLTLRWRMLHDSPLMLYVALLIDRHDAVPYRDIFDMNLPGTYLVNLALAKTLGYSDLAFRIFDLLHLTALTALTYLWTRRIHRYIAYFSVVFLPLVYLSCGPVMSLQREALALLPFSSSLAVIFNRRPEGRRGRAAIVGLLWGLCALIKPFILIGAVPVLIHIMRRPRGASSEPEVLAGGRAAVLTADRAGMDAAARAGGGPDRAATPAVIGAGVAGFLLPAGVTLVYLALTGALRPFVEIVADYIPLYARLTGDHVPIGGAERFWYLLRMTGAGLREAFWLIPGICGLAVLTLRPRLLRSASPEGSARPAGSTSPRSFAPLLAGMMLGFAVYPALSGQFWFYHWLPFTYAAVIAAGACLVPPGGARSRPARIIARIMPVMLIAVFVGLFVTGEARMTRADYEAWREQAPLVVWNGVPDRVAEYLGANLRPGDTVQPLDWNGGAVHGMLLARAGLATRFMYDFHFYHHVDSPFIEKLRREFIQELRSSPPRFIVDIARDKSRVHGPNTTGDFRALSDVIRRRYRIAMRDPSFIIYERR